MSAANGLRLFAVVAVIAFVLATYLLLPASQMLAAPSLAPSTQLTNTNTVATVNPAADPRGAPDSSWIIPSIQDVAPGYCSSTGGSTQYESISDVTWTEQSTGVYLLTVQVYIANPTNCVYGKPCQAYDSSPEYVNAWVDWNGDQQWSESERVMDKALTGYAGINYRGTMTAIAQVVQPANVPTSAASTAANEKWLRTNVGYNHDPNDPCETGWSYGNVVDKPIASNLPKIKEIQVTNASSNAIQQMPPLTGLYLKMEAILEMPEGYEEVKVKWEGPDLDFPGEGNPYTDFKPKRGDHGLRTIKATLVYRNIATQKEGKVSLEHTFKLFFAKYPDFKTRPPIGATGSDVYADGDGDKVVDWLQYWGRDGAVPALVSGVVKVVYNPSDPDYGVFKNKEQIIELGESAPKDHGLRQIDSPPNCVIKVGDTHGIDAVAEIVTHERKHEWVWQQWYGAAPVWKIGTTVDSDDPTPASKEDDKGDSLPDDFEKNESHTDPAKTDTCGVVKFSADGTYAYYGDNEFWAMKAAVGVKGNESKDWAFPGRQTTPPELLVAESSAAADEPIDQKRSGLVTEFSTVPQANSALPGVASLSGIYGDSSVDTNSDGLFEAMRVTVGVNIITPTRYSLVGWLRDSNGVDFMWANHQIDLTAGNHQVDLDFGGKLLYLHGLNGPFTLRRVELRTGEHSTLIAFADNAHTTATYLTTSFTPPAVTLNNVFADNATDTDSDTLYNFLNIQVGVDLHTPGNYTLSAWLYDANGQTVPGAVADTPFTTSGNVTLAFDGKLIRSARANGPYTVRQVEVRNDALESVAFNANAYTTAAYTANQFQGVSTVATFDASTYTDQGVDINGDSNFDYLRFSLQINVVEAAEYQIEAWLTSNQRTTLASALVKATLAAGNNIVTLDFPGGPIRASTFDGPYQVTGLLLTKSNGDVVDYHKNAHTTQPYLHTAFALPLVALTNSYRDYVTDTNGDDANDYLNIDVGLLAGNNGVVIVQGRLVNSAGATIQTVETTVAVTANLAQVATLPFSATLIAANPLDGPYTLRNLLLYHTGDPSQTVDVEEAHTTAAYNHLTLQPPLSLLFVPVVSRVNTVSPVCTPDAARETSNVNDAQTICPQQIVAGSVAVVNDRDDVFRIALPANQHVRITMSVNGGDADLYFYPPNTTDVNTGTYFARSVLTSSEEIIDTTTNAAGNWFVDAYAYQEQTNYTLKVELLGSPTAGRVADSVLSNDKSK